MTPSIEEYARQRDAFLQNLAVRLSSDERFVAAWLTGSFATGQQDTLRNEN